MATRNPESDPAAGDAPLNLTERISEHFSDAEVACEIHVPDA